MKTSWCSQISFQFFSRNASYKQLDSSSFFVFVFVLIGIHSMQAEEPVRDTDLPEKKQEDKDKDKTV